MLLNEIKRVRGQRLPSGRSLTRTEIHKLHQACKQDKSPAGERDYAIITTMLVTGIRRSEVISITIDDDNTRNDLLNIQADKGNKQHITYLNTESHIIVKQWIKTRGKQESVLFNPISKS